MLDDLDDVLSIAADAMVPVTEPMQLAEKLIAEVRWTPRAASASSAMSSSSRSLPG